MKKATTIEEQIKILIDRGVEMDFNQDKVKEILFDIGYFRLGFYCFPFEKGYPCKKNRTHKYRLGTKFSDIVSLYYLDVNLRHILIKYISRIEINFRTKIIYESSHHYKHTNTWFADPKVMKEKYLVQFDKIVYNKSFKQNNEVIKKHHKTHTVKYAPAWKTIEFITFGGILKIYQNLKDESLKQVISNHFNINNIKVFENYIETIVKIRNVCAHSCALYDFRLPKSLKNGPALKITIDNNNILQSAITVILYILGNISKNRKEDMEKELNELFEQHKDNIVIMNIVKTCIGRS